MLVHKIHLVHFHIPHVRYWHCHHHCQWQKNWTKSTIDCDCDHAVTWIVLVCQAVVEHQRQELLYVVDS
jgi:hypothetical protein